MSELRKFYKENVIPKLVEEFGYKNPMQIPSLKKVVINVGVGAGLKDKDYVETVINNLTRISGQKPVKTEARKSIASFKVREGMIVGVKVSLRGERMWDFIEKLVKITLPRVRDFRGIKRNAFDGKGNYTLGIHEYLPFPEIQPDEVEKLHGMEVSIATSAETDKEGLKLLELLGFPFKTNDQQQ